jgi:hypothetical protein
MAPNEKYGFKIDLLARNLHAPEIDEDTIKARDA